MASLEEYYDDMDVVLLLKERDEEDLSGSATDASVLPPLCCPHRSL